MKKRIASKLLVKRISTSPYFSPAFAQLEKSLIDCVGAEMLPHNDKSLAQVLITNTHTDVSNITKEQRDSCQLMIHPNSGYDNLHSDFVKSVSFPIVIGNPIRAHAVTNYILSALLHHFSPLKKEQAWCSSRKWPRKLLSECTILILGQGHVGSLISKSLEPLAARVIIHDPYMGLNEWNKHKADVVILACSLNAKNHHLIDKKFMLGLTDDFLLINAARGPLVHTAELLEVLQLRPQSFAVLDVFEQEPADFSVFSNVPNILVTSHIAGVYQNIDTVTAQFEAVVLSDWMNLEKTEFETKYKSMILKNRLSPEGFLI